MTDQPQPIEMSGFHAKDGLFFARREHGDVEVRLGDSVVVLGYSTWASVVAAVCAEGETAVNYQTARWFHMGPNSLDHPARKREPAEQPEPGVGWRLARDEEIQAATEQPSPNWRRDDACGREHTYRGECVYADWTKDGVR